MIFPVVFSQASFRGVGQIFLAGRKKRGYFCFVGNIKRSGICVGDFPLFRGVFEQR